MNAELMQLFYNNCDYEFDKRKRLIPKQKNNPNYKLGL